MDSNQFDLASAGSLLGLSTQVRYLFWTCGQHHGCLKGTVSVVPKVPNPQTPLLLCSDAVFRHSLPSDHQLQFSS